MDAETKRLRKLETDRRWRMRDKQRDPIKWREKKLRWQREHPRHQMCQSAKARAKRLGLEFNLKPTDIEIPQYCKYLKVPLDPNSRLEYCPSLDRIDSTKGYTKDNIQVISHKANRMKTNATAQELIIFAHTILEEIRSVHQTTNCKI